METKDHPEEKKEISCRITRTLLMYVQEKNKGSLGSLLNELAHDEAYLKDTNNWVSHAFLQVLYHRMIKILVDDNAVYHMTLSAERFQSLGLLDRIVRLLGSPRLIYSQAPRYNRFLKLNGSVYIHEIGDSHVVLEDRYHSGAQKTRFDCDYTRGILAGIPTLFGLPLAEVEELNCQVAEETYGQRIWPDNPSQGCRGCFYHVCWAPIKMSWLKRFFQRRSYHSQAIEELVQANQLIQSKYDEVKGLMHDLERSHRRISESKLALELQRTALIESERQYRLLAENVSDIIWVIDLASLRFEFISPSVEKQRGYSVDEAMRQSLEETLSPQSLARVSTLLEAELFKETQPGTDPHRSVTVEIEQSLKTGGYRWAEATVSFVRDAKGEATAIMGVTRDIADRREAQRVVAQSERKYRNLFENGSDLICIHDLDGNLLETNLPYKKEYGWRLEDLKKINLREMIPKHHKSKFDAYLKRLLAKDEDQGYMKGFTRSGQAVILEYRNKLMRDEAGRPYAVHAAGRDVTQRVRYEKALKVSEEKYKNLVQYAPVGIYELDLESDRFISVNDVMCAYTRYCEEDFLKLKPADLLPESDKNAYEGFKKKVFDEKPREFASEHPLRVKQGEPLWVLSNARMFYEQGTPQRAMVVVHDLTEARQAEEEKRALEEKLQNARKLESLGTLAGGVAHDLNNILSGIVGYPDLLLQDISADDPLHAPLTTIKNSGQRAAEIVQDLLTLARRSVTIKKVVNLSQIVTDFLASPEYLQSVSDRHDIHVQVEIAKELLKTMGSETHISKTVMNLITNAVDAMPAGGQLTLSTHDCYLDTPHVGFERIPQGEYAVFEVSDSGIGMPPSDLERIFEPFYTKKVLGRSGTGLGMSVVWGTIKDHDGYIDIATEEGSGTRFSLYFPASRGEMEENSSVYIEDYLGKGESILVIDDALEQRELAKRMMQRLGYVVDTATSGEEAVELVKGRDKPYDLLILDMIMPPGIDGLETYRQIIAHTPQQKAVIASGYSQTGSVKQAQKIGAGIYIKKPFTLEKIGLAVRRELDQSSPTTIAAN